MINIYILPTDDLKTVVAVLLKSWMRAMRLGLQLIYWSATRFPFDEKVRLAIDTPRGEENPHVIE
ncbi:hypothetical protein D9611_012267 [Ephemerocybe angulata]|uniref:Uncharacterized protein n=1 Tax=Ephemerocybe angulata TaxID=980116 RepID=A0A8H5ES75_9AGAR|nr:hypothetical protein D9611_012267 [Tulosesus angulatus]